MRPPALWRVMVRLAAPPADRAFIVGDLDGEYERLARERGVSEARAWYRRQAMHSLAPLLGMRQTARRHVARRPVGVGLRTDTAHAARWLRRHPGLSAAVVLTLGAALAACLATLRVADAAWWRPVPLPAPHQIVNVWTSGPSRPAAVRSMSWPDFLDLRREARTFSVLAASAPEALSLTSSGDPRRINALRVSAGFDLIVGEPPALGRYFSAEDYDASETSRVAVLQHHFWMRVFGGDVRVLGRSLILSGQPYRIVGVASSRAALAPFEPHDLWVPLRPRPGVAWESSRGTGWLTAIGRLSSDASVDRSRADVTRIARQLADEHPRTNSGKIEGRVVGVVTELAESNAPAVALLAAGVIAVLLIACGNVANLLLATTERRRVEVALRTALGAGRQQIVRQTFIEHLMLCALAGLAGSALAVPLAARFASLSPRPMPVLSATPGLMVIATVGGLLVLLLAATLTAVVELRRMDPAVALRSRSTGGRRDRALRGTLIAGQAALSLVLGVGAIAFVQTAQRLTNVDPGFERAHVLTLEAPPSPRRAPSGAAARGYYESVIQLVGAIPGVQSVAVAVGVPLTSSGWRFGIRPSGDPSETLVAVNLASDRYFETIGARLLEGRVLTADEQRLGLPAVVINAPLAALLSPAGGAVGRKLPYSGREWEVVGVIEGIRHRQPRQEPTPEVFLPWSEAGMRPQTIVVRTEDDPRALLSAITARIHSLDSEAPVSNVATLDDRLATTLGAERFRAAVLSALAIIAVVLAGMGVYSVTAHSTAQRRREFGIRLALGARPAEILKSALFAALTPMAIGVGAGALAILAARPAIASLLYRTDPGHMITLSASAAVLLLLAVAAAWRLARQASRTSPLVTLQSE